MEKKLCVVVAWMPRREHNPIFFVIAGCAVSLAVAVIVASATAASAGSDSRHQTVAIVDGHVITEQDLDSRIAGGIYQLRNQALSQFINDYLLEQAARRARLSIPEYLAKETAVTVTDADARSQYDKYKALMKVPYDQIKPRLIASLTSQRKAAREAALLEKLRSDAHVEIKLEAPRFDVGVAHSPSLGPASAPVTIVEFGDFQSTFCKMEEPALQQVRDKYKDQVRLVYKDFPPFNSKDSAKAAEAANCADEQGKFWQFHDALYADQSKLAVSDLKATARGLGLDSAKFDSCLDSGKYAGTVEEDIEEGLRVGVRSAPTFFVNGHSHAGIQSLAGFEQMIDPELQGKGRTETKSP